MRKSAFFVFILSILFLIPAFVFAKEVGKISALQGKVDLLKGGKLPAVEAKINMPVSVNDLIRTKTNSKAEITLNDRTILKVAPRSRIDISEYIADDKTIKATINLPRGKVGAFVAKASTNKIVSDPKANKFEIKTPIAVAGVRGSTFIVTHRDNTTTVFTLTGRIYTYNIKFPENIVDLIGGQFTLIKENQPPVSPMSATPGEQDREIREITIEEEEIRNTQTETLTEIENDFQKKQFIAFELPITETIPPEPEPPTPPPPPTISVNFVSATPGTVKLKYDVEASEPVIVQYRTLQQGGSWSDWTDANETPESNLYVDVPVTFAGTGSFQIQLRARNNSGVYSSEYTDPSSGYLNVFYNSVAGNITNLAYPGTADGAVVAVLGRDGKGVVKLDVIPSLGFNSVLEAGGGNSSYGWWILSLSGGNSVTGRFTESSFRLLTQQNYYTTTYPGFTATPAGSSYITGLTSDPSITVIPLSFYSAMNNFPICKPDFHQQYSGSGYLGGEGYEAYKGLYSVGNLGNVDFSGGKPYVWHNTINSPFYGYIAGWIAQRTDTQYNMNGYLAGILPDSTGIFIGELTTGGEPNVLQQTKGYWLEGQVTGVANNIGSCSPAPYSISVSRISNSSFGASLNNSSGYSFIDTAKYGVGFIGMGGTYTEIPSDNWYLSYTADFAGGAFGAIVLGSKWGTENNVQNVIRGKTYGYYSNLTPVIPVTGIFVGETVGTFNAGEASKSWQTVTVGSFIETNIFLNNTGTLGSIGIPVVEVGKVTLTGSNRDCPPPGCVKQVTMSNVTFFAHQSGKPPTVWATNDIEGKVYGSPLNKPLITLSGGGLTVDFTMKTWDANKWSATISSPPQGSGSAFGYTINDMQGVAAGTYEGKNITGTAAGAVRAVASPGN